MPPKKSSGKHDNQSNSHNSRGESSSQSSQRASTSQRTQNQTQTLTQADKAAAGIDKADLDQKVNDLVQYLLIAWQKNYPIKKLDINKNVLKEHRTAFAHIMRKAQDKLSRVFGFEVVELQDKYKGSFILINNLENDADTPHLTWSQEDQSKTGLLMVILSLIFMNGNVMQDSDMWYALKRLGITQDATHGTFGDAKKLITQEFVREGYLEYIRQQSDPPCYEFKWGQRAQLELSKAQCLSFVSQMYGTDPDRWTSQYQDALRQQENGSGDA